MSAAITAQQSGHQVILCEKNGRLGGLLNHVDVDPRKEDLKRYRDYLVDKTLSCGADIRLNTDVNSALIATLRPDAIICAVGSAPILPPIPGLKESGALSAMEAHDQNAEVGKRVVVIGGGLVGCETALYFADLGREVSVLEMAPMLAQEDAPLHRMALLQELSACVHIYAGHRCTGITEAGVQAVTPDGTTVTIPADTIVYAAGMRAKTTETDALYTADIDFYPVGDCNRARKIHDAVTEGYFAAQNL